MNNIRMAIRHSRLVILSTWFAASIAAAQVDPVTDDSDGKTRLRRAQDYASAFDLRLANGGEAIRRIDQPLLTYGDPARKNTEGMLWAWGEFGRPLMMMESFRSANGSRSNAISLTSTELVVMTTPTSDQWKPQKTQIEPLPLAKAPLPDEKESVRLRQLKEQARRFSAHEFWKPENSRYELRLLVQPVHRYRDESRAILDGAVFVLAYDNNPEVLLLIEALGPSAGKARWQYALAPMGSAELHVALDGQEVWTRGRTPGGVGKPTDPYWLMMAAEPAPETISR